MKKFLSLVLVLAITLPCLPAFSHDNISVKVDGEKLEFDVSPRLINSRTMVPLRAIFESLGASVEWDDSTQSVTAEKDDTVIKLTINQNTMYVNDEPRQLDSPACLIDGRTLVPVRAISEAFKCGVDWSEETSTVYIATNPELCMNGHVWSDATCILPKTCINCGMDNGKSLGHTTTEYSIIKDATCIESGIKSATCTVCGETIKEEIEKLAHTPSNWRTIHTETSMGKKVIDCLICGEIISEEDFEKTPTQMKDDYKFYSVPYTYLQLSRIADQSIGKKAHIKGRIMQSIEDLDSFIFLVEITKTSYGWNDIVMVTYERNEADLNRFVENEIIEIYGEIGGLYTYDTQGGSKNTVPLIHAKYIDLGYVIAE